MLIGINVIFLVCALATVLFHCIRQRTTQESPRQEKREERRTKYRKQDSESVSSNSSGDIESDPTLKQKPEPFVKTERKKKSR